MKENGEMMIPKTTLSLYSAFKKASSSRTSYF